MRCFQEKPHLLELAYQATERVLKLFRRWLVPGGIFDGVLIIVERLSKRALFDCRMCGQCVLHSTGMTCPMSCPKNLRNGPCGGVLPNGHCEINPDAPCIWVQAWERSKRMPLYGEAILELQAPLNQSLNGTSAWINDLNRRNQFAPKGW